MTQIRKSRQFARLAVLVLVSAVGLSACGGFDDDDGGGGGSAQVPGSAFASTSSFVDYVRTLAVNDTDEPLTFEGFTAPVDDSGEPTPLT